MNDDVRLLMTIPEVDFYLASLACSFIGDVNRVPSDHLASFFGIIPETKESANIKRRDRISKHGASIARWTLSITVDVIMRYNSQSRSTTTQSRREPVQGRSLM